MFNKEELNQLYRYALSLSAHEQMACDLVQEALERYLKKPVASVEKPSAYIRTIIRHLYFDLERHKKRVPMVSIENDGISYIGAVDDDAMIDVLINQQELHRLLAGLNAEENELLYLWAVEEHTIAEIAGIYERPRGTILSKLHRLKKRIRVQLGGMAEETHAICERSSL